MRARSLAPKRGVVFGLVLGAFLVTFGCGGGGEEEDLGGAPDETRPIVFQSLATNGIGIINPDGTGRRELTSVSGTDDHYDPALSPDGTQIAFVLQSGGHYTLMLMNADGTNVRALTSARTYLRAPQWHPDGSRLLYGSGSPTRIYSMTTSGTETQLTGLGAGSLPAWSPDGSKIAFVASRSGSEEDIYIAHPDGSGLTHVAATPGYTEWSPRWSPDGKRLISYAQYSTATDDRIHILNVDGSGRTAIGPLEGARPAWSPSGKRIVFASRDGTRWRLSTMLPDGTDIRHITTASGSTSEYAPNW